ncbi:helix-turn-helix domain-containing protein [Dawidia soli]|uniref:AraC family transcriptional regulator n=1 Tax=Dawidia soli TaxID=2782352 RepID=A0AAP2DAX2_9BACT|nr:AraC family transcriptional regulator [Dawidia soli]MBT1688653.1 AraC family transcriptional regulator [Dawidia soli]
MVLWDAITYEVAMPCIELQDLVSHFWCSRWHAGVQRYFTYHATANTRTEIAFAFAPGSKQKRNTVFSSIQGHSNTPRSLETGDLSEIFGVSLYSHAIPFFFDLSASALAHQLLDLREVMYTDAGTITDRLARCFDFRERVGIMTHYLKTRYNSTRNTDLPVVHAIRQMRKMHGHVTIAGLARESSLSEKQFERRFKEFSGFNPKLYSSIVRFEAALPPHRERTRFTDKALELGYYDQAHFINDFKRYSGFTPRTFAPVTW